MMGGGGKIYGEGRSRWSCQCSYTTWGPSNYYWRDIKDRKHDNAEDTDIPGLDIRCKIQNSTLENHEIFSPFDPSIQSQIIRLDLSENSIQQIPARYFQKVPNLRYLDLSGNNIERLEPDVFEGLDHLEELHLERTNLFIKTLPPGVFRHTGNLKYLNLKCLNTMTRYLDYPKTNGAEISPDKPTANHGHEINNLDPESMSYTEPTFPDDVFVDLKNVEYLGLSIFMVEDLKFGPAFTEMKSLTFLDFYESSAGESDPTCGDYNTVDGLTYMYNLAGLQFGSSVYTTQRPQQDGSHDFDPGIGDKINHTRLLNAIWQTTMADEALHFNSSRSSNYGSGYDGKPYNGTGYNGNADSGSGYLENPHNGSYSNKTYSFEGHRDNKQSEPKSFNHNRIYLRNDTFLPLKNSQLKKLNLKSVGIRGVETCVWCPLKSLETLDISCNDEFPLSFSKWTDSFYGLQGNAIETIIMDKIVDPEIPGDESWSFNEETFRFLKNTKIRQISLAGNSINEISPILGSVFPYLEYLSLKANSIWKVYGELRDLVLLDLFTSSLKVLDLGYMLNAGGSTVKCWVPSELWFKNFIDDTIAEDKIHRCESPGALLEYLEYKAAHPERNVAAFPLPFEIEEIYANNLPFYSTTGQAISYTPIFVLNNNHLRRISAEGVSLQQLRHDFLGVKCLEYINVRDNKINFIKPDFFRNHLPNIRTFLVGDNQLGQQLSDENGNGSLFENVTSLQVLDMSSNGIPSLNKHMFRGLQNLRVLNISRNYQFGKSGFDLDVKDLGRLVYLDLSYTSSGNFSKNVRKFFDVVNESGRLTIDLTGVKFPCDCNNQGTIKWVQNSSIKFINKNSYTCDATLNQPAYNFIHEVNTAQLAIHCVQEASEVTDIPLIQILLPSLAGCILLLAMLAFVGHKYRWKLRYHFYLAKCAIRNPGHRQVQDEFKYDAFVAYNHSEDYTWIIDELIPQLETKNNLSLLIGQRDFRPGHLILDNIIDAIETSRKTILVLTPHFAQSSWCNWEMKFSLAKGENCVIPIMLQQIPQEMMSQSLRRILSTVTYLEWSNDDDAKPLFWKKLSKRLAMPNQNV